jgi:hypothetical protein
MVDQTRITGERRDGMRQERNPGKTASKQGGTPDMPTAK